MKEWPKNLGIGSVVQNMNRSRGIVVDLKQAIDISQSSLKVRWTNTGDETWEPIGRIKLAKP